MELKSIQPVKALTDFVESFWMIRNDSAENKDIILLPDGRFDIIFSAAANEPFHATLRGLDTHPHQGVIPGRVTMFAVSFKLLAIEYLLDNKVAAVLNEGERLPAGFWNIVPPDLEDFERFCEKISATMLDRIKPGIDNRKKELFDLIYASNGTLTVQELSDQVAWSSRQINRYFNAQFGISLKAYCNIFRFKASLQQIKEGRLFPELNFADQTHFIKEIKRFSGVVPKELAKNQNGRFILLSDAL
ncbi:helix-turn-helix transcriptional regulator [Chitinophaga polysaccharea]|uniref:helix-turn-helix domain-containing protein n=1 Tax=Chitinophaga TaxID=79328 RepID=UPI0014559DA5|nr:MULTISPECIES: AraC family transcriptional regulator [Chitinophaga]NLR62591.1 helix-turn-helix transcriptional regulator [Chitinophaga polysaccharea]NLU91475.1 helix-turn-helix transcriptional regulator [Chitinophaga sp. Ak27]